MSLYKIIGLALALVLGSSCQSSSILGKKKHVEPDPQPSQSAPVEEAPQREPLGIGSGSSETQLQLGKALLNSGNYMGAIKQFAYLRDHANTIEERDRAVIGLSMALQESGNSGAALGVLEPLPVVPSTQLDAMKCVLAGELFLHQKNIELAVMWLARGLEVEPESRKSYRSTAWFNLGKALLAEGNLEDAYDAFMSAQELFVISGDEANAQQCKLILSEISVGLE